MRYTIKGKIIEVFLEKQFDCEPEYKNLFKFPETSEEKLECGIWEEREAILEKNCPIDDFNEICPHFVQLFKVVLHTRSGQIREEIHGYVPRVLIAYNEGKCATTGICLDCLLESLQNKKEKVHV